MMIFAPARATRSQGFTLIELMITVVIVGIIAAVAIPNYSAYVKRGRRVDAKTALLDLAARQERYFAVNNQYTLDAANKLGYTAASVSNTSTVKIGQGYYNMTITYSSGTDSTTWTATAAPTTLGGQSTDACGSYTLTSLGAQTNTLVTAGTTGCW